jgi:hypothetical protein
MPRAVITSARKYIDDGIYKTQSIFFLIFFIFYLIENCPLAKAQ